MKKKNETFCCARNIYFYFFNIISSFINAGYSMMSVIQQIEQYAGKFSINILADNLRIKIDPP